MKHAIYILIFALVFLSCNIKIQRNSGKIVPADSLIQPTNQARETTPQITIDSTQLDRAKIECMPNAYKYGDSWTNFAPGTFEEITYLYNSINPDAKITDTLPFNTAVNILSEYDQYFLVCTPEGKTGYVKKSDLYLHTLSGIGTNFYYLVGLTKYGTTSPINCNSSVFKIIKINTDKKVFDVYVDSIMGKDYEINNIHNTVLKNAEALFYIRYHCFGGIGLVADHFIIDNGKLSRLILANGSVDGEQSDISNVYLPVRLMNGKKVVLAKNGMLTVDETTAKVETYPYPADCGIPIEELIVVVDKSEDVLFGQYNKDGTVAAIITNKQTTYYQWNGMTLRKVKTIK